MGWILIVEDKVAISNRLHELLEEKNFKVLPCYEYQETIRNINELIQKQNDDKASYSIDVIICDLNIHPVQNKVIESVGFQILKYIKEKSPDTCRIIYTGNDPGIVAPKCVGLGEFFFQKTSCPGHTNQLKATPRELVDFVCYHLNHRATDTITQKGAITFNHTRRIVTLNGIELSLNSYELDLLEAMINKEDEYFNVQHLLAIILETVDIPLFRTEERFVMECMRGLYIKLGNSYITQRKGLGYSFSVPRI